MHFCFDVCGIYSVLLPNYCPTHSSSIFMKHFPSDEYCLHMHLHNIYTQFYRLTIMAAQKQMI